MANLNAVKFLLAAFGCGILLVACGDDVTKVTEVSKSGLEVVVSADSLGKCTAERSGEMKFASKENAVFVCADSAWKNVSAAEKASCSAESLKDSSGYKIVCGGDSVGVMRNGKDGKDGEKGEAGADGKYCTVEESPLLDSDLGRGGYLVVCGGDTVGTLRDGLAGEGCSVTDNGDGSVSQVCGSDTVNLYKAFCGNKPFDPDSSFCYEDSVVARCGGKSYDLSESFCLGDSIYALCGGNRFDPETEFCYADSIVPLCNGKSYGLDSSFCYGDSVVALCGGKTYDLQDETCENGIAYGSVTDVRDNQIYKTVRIGEQVWMAENLNYVDSLMKTVGGNSSSFCYDDDSENCKKYGRLYFWSAAMDSAAVFTEDGRNCGWQGVCSPAYPVRGICPVGWHLPDSTEWRILNDFVAEKIGSADSVGYALKSASGWKSYNDKTGGSDAFGFGALPAGNITDDRFMGVTISVEFWSSTKICNGGSNIINSAYSWTLHFTRENFKRNSGYQVGAYALSIRCVKDN